MPLDAVPLKTVATAWSFIPALYIDRFAIIRILLEVLTGVIVALNVESTKLLEVVLSDAVIFALTVCKTEPVGKSLDLRFSRVNAMSVPYPIDVMQMLGAMKVLVPLPFQCADSCILDSLLEPYSLASSFITLPVVQLD